MPEDYIAPEQFFQWFEHRDAADGIVIDVREDWEWDYYHLKGSQWIPMKTIPGRLSELPSEQPIYVICAHDTIKVTRSFVEEW